MTLIPHIVINTASLAGQQLQLQYDGMLVTLSYVLAAFASFVTLRLVGHMRTTPDKVRQRLLIIVAGLSLGSGIWAMHFTGMLACTLPVEIRYDPTLTLLSLLIPIAVCGFGIFWIRAGYISGRRLLNSGTVMGLAIALMHHVGMAAMRAPVGVFHRADLFLLSIAIGIVAVITAFWFAQRFSDQTKAEPSALVAIGTSAIMAAAMTGMHYTGMAALILIDRPELEIGESFAIDPHIMAAAIAATLLIVLSVAHLTLVIEKGTSGRIRLATVPLLMAAMAAGSGGIAVAVLYDTALRLERGELMEIARAQRDLIEAVARFDAIYSASDVTGGAAAATIGKIHEAHGRFAGFGKTGEFYLARTDGDAIQYLVPLRFAPEHAAFSSRMGSTQDRPMQLALRGMTGTTVGPDYRNERVLAAYTPIAPLDLGLVIKLDMREIRTPFAVAGILAGLVTLVLIIVGIRVSAKISSPVVDALDEKARLEVELELARAVQQGLLPTAPPEQTGVQVAARTLPARFVSGDFYDFIEIDSDRLAMIVGDVSGKGVSAALLMARVLSDVRHAFGREHDPARVLTEVNQALLVNVRRGMFATACCLVVDAEARRLDVANAGHLPMTLRLEDGTMREIGHASGPPLGVVDDPGYVREQHVLGERDTIVAYTDGVIEPRDPRGSAYGVARLHQLISGSEADPDHLIDALYQSIEAFTEKAAQSDDLTLLVLRLARGYGSAPSA
jgi:serine phosphatase RsbU (regulator of sigma subunit)/NO-binding membrane sensor protein with MHYT domain